MQILSLAFANQVINYAFSFAEAENINPLAIAILDYSGELKALQRQDGASPIRPTIAAGKAWGALYWQKSSREIETFAQSRPEFHASIATANTYPIVPAAGGLMIRNANKEILGSIGISGDTSDNDERVAKAGLDALGYLYD